MPQRVQAVLSVLAYITHGDRHIVVDRLGYEGRRAVWQKVDPSEQVIRLGVGHFKAVWRRETAWENDRFGL